MQQSVWVDGALLGRDEAHVSIFDRGFQLGDGIFETRRARRGVAIEIDEHLERLAESAGALELGLPPLDTIRNGLAELLAANGLDGAGGGGAPGAGGGPVSDAPGDAAVRITVTRGRSFAGGLIPAGFDDLAATVGIQATAYTPPLATSLERGIRAITSSQRHDPSSPLAGVKSTSRADYVRAKLDARRAGADDAIFLTTNGDLSESTSANLFLVRDGRLLTSPLDAAILAGTTRGWLLAHGATLGAPATARALRPEELLAADEAFLSSSVAGIIPLVSIDGHAIGSGRPGERTLALRIARERWIDACSLGEPDRLEPLPQALRLA